MTTQTRQEQTGSPREFEAAGERVSQFNERALDLGRQTGLSVVDAYEKGVSAWADYADRVAVSSQSRRVAGIARAQAGFAREATRISAGAARDLLK